jgi:hypothetical protein
LKLCDELFTKKLSNFVKNVQQIILDKPLMITVSNIHTRVENVENSVENV